MNKKLNEAIENVIKTKKPQSLIYIYNDYHKTKLYNHFREYLKIAKNDFLSFIERLNEEKVYAYEQREQLVDMGEHPEWHIYDMTCNDVEFKATEEFYKQGGVRFMVDEQLNVYFEGKTYGIETIKQDILSCHKHKLLNKINVRNVDKLF